MVLNKKIVPITTTTKTSKYQVMNIEQIYQTWEKNLETKYHSFFPNAISTIWDGVINPTLYYEAPLKLMFINKESPDNDEYKLNHIIREQIAHNIPLFKGYHNFKDTIMLETTLFNFLTKSNKWDITTQQSIEILNNIEEKAFNKDFEKCAICNIKKSNGKNYSNTNDLNNYLYKGIDILEEQIAFFNPSIIIGGNICDKLLERYFKWGENLYVDEKEFKIYQIKIRDNIIPYFDLYHPSAFGKYKIDTNYCCRIWKAIKKIEQERPYYWENILNKRCFVV